MYVNSIYKNNMIISWLLTLLFILFHVSFFFKKILGGEMMSKEEKGTKDQII
jgi:hypothetical protein